MWLEQLSLRNFRSYRHVDIDFRGQDGPRNFTCFHGPNGIGKTTILEAITLLCSSLDYSGETDDPMLVQSAQERIVNYLTKYIRNIDEDAPGQQFSVIGTFQHEGQRYKVELGEKGFVTNEIVKQPFWWPGISLYAKFDTEMTNFQLQEHIWPAFKKAWEEITGFSVEPQVEQTRMGPYVIGFLMMKPDGKVQSRKASAGEKKLAKSLSQIVNLESERRPHIVLVDNIEMHVHWKRHLRMVDTLKELFKGMQIISATHSLPIINEYQPKADLIDLETVKESYHVQESGDRHSESSEGSGGLLGEEEVRPSGLLVPGDDNKCKDAEAGVLPSADIGGVSGNSKVV